MKQTIYCPVCGAAITIEVNNGNVSVLSHNHASDCGVNNPNLSTSQRSRLEALIVASASGEISGRYFAMENGGSARIHTIKNGVPTPVSDVELDDIEKSLYINGYVRNTRLFRRFVLAQIISALNSRGGFNSWLRNKGYRYSWRTIIEEFRVLNILRTSDAECYNERKRFFTRDVVKVMAFGYIQKLERYIDNAKIRRCKGKPYKRIGGRDVYVNDIESNIMEPLKKAYDKLCTCPEGQLYTASLSFYKRIPLFMSGLEDDSWFVDAYKGNGAYFAMKNLILFHGCTVVEDGRQLTMYESLDHINKVADKYMPQHRGYVLLGMLKSLIEYNNFDFKSRMEQLGVYDE